MALKKLLYKAKVALKDLPDHHKKRLRAVGTRAMNLVPHKGNLEILCLKYGGDKLAQGYLPHYQQAFSPIRKKALTILEIGVGGFDDPHAGGESLRMWRDYFPHSTIYGIDIVDKTSLNEDRLKIYQGDQSDPMFLNNLISEIGTPDIIIDDGSHQNAHVIASFETLFPLLADDGIYVIEDLYTSYWNSMGGGWSNGAETGTSMAMLKQLTDAINYRYIPNRNSHHIDNSVVSVQFFRKLAFVYKGANVTRDPDHVMQDLAKETQYRQSGER